MSTGIIRRLRGALGNALIWGAAWAGLGFVAATLFSGSVLSGLVLGVKFGIFGGITGVAFSIVVPLVYQGRRLSSISPVRFGLFGGIVAGVFAPLFMQTMNVLGGDGLIAWGLVLDDVPFTALFGGLAAGGSLWLAQRAGALGAGREPGRLGAADPTATAFTAGVRDRAAR